MRTLINIWKKIALERPRTYLFFCWLILGALGILAGAGVEVSVLSILFIGYFINIIWMMRIS